MNSASNCPQFDGIWLQSRNYAVVPLNSQLAGRISELSGRSSKAYRRLRIRTGTISMMSSLKTDGRTFHVRDDAQTVYLVAYSCS